MPSPEVLFHQYYSWVKDNLPIVGIECPFESVSDPQYFNFVMKRANRSFPKDVDIEIFRLAYVDVCVEYANNLI